ncbi:HAMP domain-containing sensor histidine kinase [Oceanirhabdus sp. W0125-5]|uniref:HAMP domain-containing sensor histidine kinase n=1 Tax=Oceanirhabdus sp. W0125-5 TaxID=2999116 RepID=UPI0022F2D0DB|nr:HAMP domain-containing sensor histidine kinase [Oceanirhabdus sp. W0125-5]WBW98333.1 HAMP domain-containing sensor histidine kinase [Oceanirhabdus sp. W0125-5]
MKKNNKNLKSIFLKNYVFLILGIILVALITGSMLMILLMNVITGAKSEDFPRITAQQLVRADYDNIDGTMIMEYDGWIEILYNNEVIHVIGEKLDDKMSYTRKELLDRISSYGLDMVIDEFSTTATEFQGVDGKTYTCLVIFPINQKGIHFGLGSEYDGTNIDSKFSFFGRFIGLSFIGGIVILVLIFSKRLNKKIVRPLEKLSEGIKDIDFDKLGKPIEINAPREIEYIKDSINDMTKRLVKEKEANHNIMENKKRMIRDISHDLKTPITTIQGYSRLLIDDDNIDKVNKKKYLGYIHDKSIRLNYLIESLFNYTKLDSGDFVLKRVNGDMSQFLREFLVENHGDIESRGFELIADIPDREIKIRFDRFEMERALSNLIGNALKYNPQGTKIECSLKADEENITIVIMDDGVGMDEHIKEDIFKEFTRGDYARRTDGGSGLGLAITKKIIELHGGVIRLETEKNKGARFIMIIPKSQVYEVKVMKR